MFRWTFVFVLLGMLHVHANAYRQNRQQVTLSMKAVSLKDVLWAIERQTSFVFMYNEEDLDKIGKVDVDVQGDDIRTILNVCLRNTNLTYVLQDEVIVIKPEVQSQKVKEVRIKGTVKDEKGHLLPGVTVFIKGLQIGTVTDGDGRFTIAIPDMESIVLQFSFVGMLSKEVKYEGQEEIHVVLRETKEELEEVVVTGYANIRKESFTGNATTVTKDQLLKTNNKNVIAALQTFDPSFRIQTNNQWGSDPNAMPEMYIRGRSGIGVKELDPNYTTKGNLENNPNLPTFIMDGFEVNVQKVYDMDPNRIESITILKDAAATAMYGSRAANGVVVITTVAPKPGEVTVTYSLTGGVTFPDLSDFNLANAEEKLEIERLAGLYDPEEGATSISKQDAYWRRYKNIAEGADTDWISKPLRNAVTHKHSLYIEGGNSDLRYALDASFNGDNGVMKKSYRNRTGVGFSVDYRLKNFQVKNYILEVQLFHLLKV